MPENYSIDKVREAKFFYQSSVIAPKMVFDIFYSCLHNFIEYNKQCYGSHTSIDRRKNVEMLNQAIRELELLERDMTCTVQFDSCENVRFRVIPRKRFEGMMLKEPSIVELYSEKGLRKVVREARNSEAHSEYNPRTRIYDSNGILRAFAKKRYNIDMFDDKKRTCLVPEPLLVLGLENLVREGIISRVTPPIKILQYENGNMWYLRDYLEIPKRILFDIPTIMGHVGTFHGLGLVTLLDNDKSHYCQHGENLVNIDPDLILYTKDKNIINEVDFRKVEETFSSMGLFGIRMICDAIEARTRTIKGIRKDLKGKNFMDYIASLNPNETARSLSI